MIMFRNIMIKTLLVLACFSASIFGILSLGYGSDVVSVAMIFKTVQDVTRKSLSTEWVKASKGENLVSGDQLKTGQRSLAVVKFLDNSILRVREQSVLTISGEGSRGSAIKTIQLNGGAVGFDVQKQHENELFQLTSPTSVASIRGTKGKWSGGRGNDTLIVTEGLVNLKNNATNQSVNVPGGFIGFSNQDGSVSSRKATDQELADASIIASNNSLNELDLQFKDPQGQSKELKLKYNR